MAFKAAETFATTLPTGISAGTTAIPLSASAAAVMTALIGTLGTHYTELSVNDGINYEIIRALSMVGSAINVTRGVAGTPAAFPAGSTLRFVWTEGGIETVAAAVGAAITITPNVVGAVTGGPATFNLNVPVYSVSSALTLTGIYPNFTLGLAGGDAPSTGTVTVVTGSSDLVITTPNTSPAISLSNIFPTVVGGNTFGAGMLATGAITGIRVSNTGRLLEVAASSLPNGTYSTANITVANGIITAIANGTVVIPVGAGSVTSVSAGTGIAISGVPTANPTVAIANTGVVAGVYEGLSVNAQGQIVAVPGGFGPISSITTLSPGILITNGGTGIRNIAIAAGTDAAPGLVEFASNSEAVNFATINKAIDPLRLKLAINSVGRLTSSVSFSGGLTGAGILTHQVQSATPSACEDLFIWADILFSDPLAGVNQFKQVYAFGIWVNGVAVASMPAFEGAAKSMCVSVSAFIGGVVELRSTTPAGSQTVIGSLLTIATQNM